MPAWQTVKLDGLGQEPGQVADAAKTQGGMQRQQEWRGGQGSGDGPGSQPGQERKDPEFQPRASASNTCRASGDGIMPGTCCGFLGANGSASKSWILPFITEVGRGDR